MSTETLEATTTEEVASPTEKSYMDGARARFEAELDKVKVVESKPEAKVETPKPEEKTSGIPDQFLSEKPAESKPEDEEEKLLNEAPKGQISHEHYDKVKSLAKQRIAAAQSELKVAQDRIKELESRGVDEKTTAELEQIRKERDQYAEHLERVAFEKSPKFQKEFVEKEGKIIARAERYLTEGGAEAAQLKDILAASGARQIQLIEDLDIPNAAKQKLTAAISELDGLHESKADALATSKERQAQWEQETKTQREAEIAREREQEKRVFDQIGQKISTVLEPFMEVPGNDAWNAQVAENKRLAHEFAFGDLPAEKVLEIAYYGVAGQKIHEMFHTVKKANSELRAKVAALEAAQPSAGASRGGTPTPSSELTGAALFEHNLAHAGR